MTKKILSLIILICFIVNAAIFAQTKEPEKSVVEAKTAAISYGIVIDNSGSYRTLLDRIVELVKNIAEENKPDDETFLVSFVSSDKIKLQQDFTYSIDDIQQAAESMYIEGGLTAILDAVDFSARHLSEKAKNKRKVLVLITDGDERQSKIKIDDVLKFAKENDVRVYAVGISDEKVSGKILDRLTKETGGKKYVPKTVKDFPAMIKELSADIRAQ